MDNLTAEEIKLIQQHRERQQIAGSLTAEEKAVVADSRNRTWTLADLDRWDSLTRTEQASLKAAIAKIATAAQAGQ